ncbi:MAG: hypothetical protein IJD10_01695 [Clostridia bacterium]|nr:hypothetical protein [Clostridia bacterium]
MAKDTKNEEHITGAEKSQKRLLKYKRAGVVLSEDQVREIKEGRKKLRADMRAQGIRSKKEFELTASSLGLYFDKNRGLALLFWFLKSKGGWILLGSAAALLLALYGLSAVTELRGHFTVSLSDDMVREGFTLSETKGFENPTTHLFATPAEGVPCMSIMDIPTDVGQIDGAHNDTYFAYTFYVRNEGESTQGLDWALTIRGESQNLSEAAWMMIFVDDKMSFYAKANGERAGSEMLPGPDNFSYAYSEPPLYEQAADPDGQYEKILSSKGNTYWRVKPIPFLTEDVIQKGRFDAIVPEEVHKFTVVIWLEGDDPDCTNDLIGGHLGLEFEMKMVEED